MIASTGWRILPVDQSRPARHSRIRPPLHARVMCICVLHSVQVWWPSLQITWSTKSTAKAYRAKPLRNWTQKDRHSGLHEGSEALSYDWWGRGHDGEGGEHPVGSFCSHYKQIDVTEVARLVCTTEGHANRVKHSIPTHRCLPGTGILCPQQSAFSRLDDILVVQPMNTDLFRNPIWRWLLICRAFKTRQARRDSSWLRG